jgi:hypothetical protein
MAGLRAHDPGDLPGGDAIYGLPWVRDAEGTLLP